MSKIERPGVTGPAGAWPDEVRPVYRLPGIVVTGELPEPLPLPLPKSPPLDEEPVDDSPLDDDPLP
ncbi:hypothetical protein FKW78_25855 [Mycolicibacterium fortuitum]|nr:hypothetical protein FKW78_25855 [Mycolicibacterium fortuitum]